MCMNLKAECTRDPCDKNFHLTLVKLSNIVHTDLRMQKITKRYHDKWNALENKPVTGIVVGQNDIQKAKQLHIAAKKKRDLFITRINNNN